MAPEKLQALAAIDLKRMPLVAQGARLGTPVAGARQFVAIGLNYRKHAQEAGMEIPQYPVVFTKAPSTVIGPGVNIPSHLDPTRSTDYEGELGVVIGTGDRKSVV